MMGRRAVERRLVELVFKMAEGVMTALTAVKTKIAKL